MASENFFDRFDKLDSAPAPKKQEANFFDQFDAEEAAQPQNSETAPYDNSRVNPYQTFEDVTNPNWQNPRYRHAVSAEDAPNESANPDWHKDFQSGTLGEMGHQLKAGFTSGLPEMAGNAIQAYSGVLAGLPSGDGVTLAPSVSPEDRQRSQEGIDRGGRALAEYGARKGQFMEPDMEGRGETAKAFINASRSIAPSLASMTAGPLAPAVAFALFSGDQYTQTFGKMKAAGKSDEEAHAAALKTGSIQGGGEAVASALGVRALGFMKPVATAGMGRFVGQAADTSVVKPWLKASGVAMAGNAATEVVQDVGTEAVERDAGLAPSRDYSEIAKESGGAGAAMSVMLSPLGLAGHYRNGLRGKAINEVLLNPNAAPAEQRQAVVDMLHHEAKGYNVPGADDWHAVASEDVANNRPINRADGGTQQEADWGDQNEAPPAPSQEQPEAPPQEQQPAALGHNPERMITMPDGTTAWESELAGLQQDAAEKQNDAIARQHPAYPSELAKTADELEAELGQGQSVDDQIAALEAELAKPINFTPPAIPKSALPMGAQTNGPIGNEIDYSPAGVEPEGLSLVPKEESAAPDYRMIDPPAPNLDSQLSNLDSQSSPLDTLAQGVEAEIGRHIDKKRAARLPDGLKDNRLLRDHYRGALEGMASDLTEGGGISYLRDENDRITGRTKSTNPSWFQSLNTDPSSSMSVKNVRKAVANALAGKKLFPRQARVIQAMLDEHQFYREDYARQKRADRQEVQNTRRAALDELHSLSPEHADLIQHYGDYEQAKNAGQLYAEPNYRADLNHHERANAELAEQAWALGASYDDIDSAVESGHDSAETTKALHSLIFGLRNEHRQRQADDRSGNRRGSENDVLAPESSERVNQGGPEENHAPAGRLDQESPDAAQPASGQVEPFALDQQTEESAKAEADRLDAIAKADAESKTKAEQKDKADSDAKDFKLTGSDSPSDIAASHGQNDLFAGGGKAKSNQETGGDESQPPPLKANGFIAGPDGYRVRISQHALGSNMLDPEADAGAFVYEIRKGDNDSDPLNMVLNKEGRLVARRESFTDSNKSNGTVWVPPSNESADKVRGLLEKRAATRLGSEERKAIDNKIKEVVTRTMPVAAESNAANKHAIVEPKQEAKQPQPSAGVSVSGSGGNRNINVPAIKAKYEAEKTLPAPENLDESGKGLDKQAGDQLGNEDAIHSEDSDWDKKSLLELLPEFAEKTANREQFRSIVKARFFGNSSHEQTDVAEHLGLTKSDKLPQFDAALDSYWSKHTEARKTRREKTKAAIRQSEHEALMRHAARVYAESEKELDEWRRRQEPVKDSEPNISQVEPKQEAKKPRPSDGVSVSGDTETKQGGISPADSARNDAILRFVPPSIIKGLKVDAPVFDENTGETHTEKVPAQEALDAVNADIETYKSLLNCVRGG